MIWIKTQSFHFKLEIFQEEGVNGEMLLKINESDLKDMGISRLVDRKGMMYQIKKISIL